MQKLLPISAGILVISGIVSFTMWSDLKKERKLTSDLQTQLTEANARIQSLTLAAQNNNTQQMPAVASTASTGDVKPDSPAPAPARAPPAPPIAANDYQAREKEMMKDPEYRKARLAQQRMSTERNYPGLVDELGLSQKEADRLFEMLAENQMNRSAEMSAIRSNGGQPDQAAMDEMQRKLQALDRKQDEEIAAVIGAGKAAQYQEYKQTRGSRMQVAQWGTQLAQVGQPLTDVQQRGLTSVMVAEEKRMTQQMQQMEATARAINQADPQASMQLQEQAMKMMEEMQRRVLDAAAAHLTQRQIASLRQQFESEMAMSQAQMRLDRRRAETQGAGR